ncbi:MAG: cephalosporin hydroxylase family protein [Planctomycetaceae bacterium]|nr:cephalosporin hydroxylase family protein [Planctomycetaceae bacterium]
MDHLEKFKSECAAEIVSQGNDEKMLQLTSEWVDKSFAHKYSYHFSWLGRPIIQYPQDMVAMQEIIASVQPDLIIETGIAHGGGLIFYASLLELNAICGGPANAKVVGIDIELRDHNRRALEEHPLFKRIEVLDGSSIAPEIVKKVTDISHSSSRIMVCLDSNHTHQHVLKELEAYGPLVSHGSYCVVFDTIVEYMRDEASANRPWEKGDNPMTAVQEFLRTHDEFTIDTAMDSKLLISVAPRGYLRKK